MNKSIFNEFKQYHSLLILGFIGGIIAWIFSFTFESLQDQITNFWALFGASLFVALVWYFILSIPLFLILKLLGLKFGK